MKKYYSIFAMILLLASLGQVAADLYLPSLPAIAHGLMTKIGSVQLSVSVYMLGFALSQLVYGPLSDGIGRKIPLLIGLALLLIGSLVCVSATSITGLIIGRCLQGAGTGANFVLSRAILRDTFSGNNLAKFGSYLAAGSIIIMASAPLIGGYIQSVFNWRGNFMLITLYAVIMLLLVGIKLPETNQHKDTYQLNVKQLLQSLSTLIRNKVFVSMSVMIFLAYACIVAWLTSGPVLLELHAGLTPVQFGWIAVITGAAYGIGSMINGKLLSKYGINFMFKVGLGIMLIASFSMLVISLESKSINVYSTVIPVAIFIAGSGFVFANAFACALHPFAKIAGIAGCVFGCLEILGGASSSALLSHLHESTQSPLAAMLLIASGISAIAFWKVRKLIK